MRKLLVASQKGGVGKTTTSINLAAATAMAGARVLLLDADPLSSISSSLGLAEHSERQSLRQAGIDLPGVLVCNVIPGLDVLSPYEDGGCSDDELDQVLALLSTPAFQECYSCLIVDTPPFMGANPGQLLATCDEFMLVMRAEPLAYRTLPAFLELVQRARTDHPVKLRGILLTLPDGEQVNGRWERELRGRFGTRILPQVVPFDDSVAQSLMSGQVVSHSHRDSPVSQAYHGLVELIELASDARETIERTSAASALLLASASLKNSSVARKPVDRSFQGLALGRSSHHNKPRPVEPTPVPTPPPPPPVFPSELLADSVPDIEDLPAPVRRRMTPTVPIPVVAASVTPPSSTPLPAAYPMSPVNGNGVGHLPAHPASMHGQGPGSAPMRFPIGVGLLWMGAAIAVGVGLRFVRMPDFMVPIIVGVAVAAVVVLLLRLWLGQTEPTGQPVSAGTAEGTRDKRPAAARRLSGLTRRLTARSNVSEN